MVTYCDSHVEKHQKSIDVMDVTVGGNPTTTRGVNADILIIQWATFTYSTAPLGGISNAHPSLSDAQ